MKTKLIKSLIAIFILCPAAAFPDNTWIVDQGGGGDFTTIQDCIEAASAGETCRVNAGTYVENIEFRYGKDLTVESSSGPEVTIIDGNSTYSVVLFIDGSQSILRGFTLQNGNNAGGGIHCVDSSSPTIEDCIITDNIAAPPAGPQGGGIYCYYYSSPIIRNCIISDNSAELGGGIYYNYHCSPMIINCTISNNTATNSGGGGIYCGSWSSAHITDCTFSGNTATYLGGGILCSHSSPTITNCTFSTNISGTAGGGIDCQHSSSPTINSCTFTENTAGWYGGGVWCGYSSSPTITNCIFAGNSAESYHGGGIACSSSSFPIITNCTLSGNTAKYYGGGIVSTHSSSPTITNCILWENSAYLGPELALQYPSDPSSLDVSYSDIEGGEAAVYVAPGCTLNWGDGNINADPLFVGGGDYHLTADSPCIDAGAAGGAPNTDFEGDSRPQGIGYDMGADEYTGVVTGNYNLANISTISNDFQLWSDISIDRQALTNICENYGFEVREDSDNKTTQVNCECLANEPTQILYSKRYRIWFKINPDPQNPKAAYFKDGNVYMCKKENPSECVVFKELDTFSVYGTTFDMEQHAWRFENGWWYYAILYNFPYRIADIVASYFKDEKRSEFWKFFDINIFSSNGGCYGLTETAIANFSYEVQGWGTGSIEEWGVEINDHWDYINIRPYPPYKPFNTDKIHSDEETFSLLTKWTKQSCKKIMYYFAAQNHFNNMGNMQRSWIGKDQPLYIRPEGVIPILKSGSPVSLIFDIAHHSVASTQLIRWNNHDKYMIWDNNHPYGDIPNEYGPYLEWYVGNDSEYNDLAKIYLIKYVMKSDGNGYYSVEKFFDTMSGCQTRLPGYIPGDYRDSQNIYNLWNGSSSSQSYLLEGKGEELLFIEQSEDKVDYPYPEHIEVLIIGAHLDEITEKDTGYPVTLIPYGEIVAGQATVRSTGAGIFEFLYLPADKIYRIQSTKYADFMGLKVFVSVPKNDGTVERLNYEHVETGENDPTNIYFFVGRDNADKGIRRNGEGDIYNPDYVGALSMHIGPPQHFQGIYEDASIKLMWQNTTHPNLVMTRILRKEGDFPDSPFDGVVIYEGLAEEATDYGAVTGNYYYYAAYSVDTDSNFSGPAYFGLDTALFSVYGKVTLATDEGVDGAQLVIKDSEEKVLDIATTGSNGAYTLSNIENGNYVVQASHVSHEIQNADRNVTINNQNVQEDFIATPVPTLFLIHDFDEVVVGSTLVIQWAYRNINNSQHVDIALNRGQGWEIIDDNADIVAGQVEWQVSGPNSETAVLRISLSDDPMVYDEDSVDITVPICECDINHDNTCDMQDWLLFGEDWGRTDCGTPPGSGNSPNDCECDLNGDGGCDMQDWLLFGEDWGRTDCPN